MVVHQVHLKTKAKTTKRSSFWLGEGTYKKTHNFENKTAIPAPDNFQTQFPSIIQKEVTFI